MDTHRLDWQGTVLALTARRAGLRTRIVLHRDGQQVAEGSGAFRVLLPLPDPDSGADGGVDGGADGRVDGGAEGSADGGLDSGADRGARPPTVLVLSVVPGVPSRALLLVPRPEPDSDPGGQDDGDPRVGGRDGDPPADLPKGVAGLAGLARAERFPFVPPPGSFAARLLEFQRAHPRLYAARHVVLATGQVLLALAGVSVLVGLVLQRVLRWLLGLLPDVDLPSIPWPDIDLPSLPWPDVSLPDLPEISVPGWLVAVATTAKYWAPILVAVAVAAREVRRRRGGAGRRAATGEDQPADTAAERAEPGGDRDDAHR